MKTILHWDPRFPVARPVRLELDDAVASAFVRAGVAAPANQADAAALQTGGALDPGNMVEIIIWSGPSKERLRIFVPGAVADAAIAAGAATYPGRSGGTATPSPSGTPFTFSDDFSSGQSILRKRTGWAGFRTDFQNADSATVGSGVVTLGTGVSYNGKAWTVDAGRNDSWTYEVTGVGATSRMNFSIIDENNFWELNAQSNLFSLTYVKAGTRTSVVSNSVATLHAPGDRYGFVLTAGVLTILKNGAPMPGTTSYDLAAVSGMPVSGRCGFQVPGFASGASLSYDDFALTTGETGVKRVTVDRLPSVIQRDPGGNTKAVRLSGKHSGATALEMRRIDATGAVISGWNWGEKPLTDVVINVDGTWTAKTAPITGGTAQWRIQVRETSDPNAASLTNLSRVGAIHVYIGQSNTANLGTAIAGAPAVPANTGVMSLAQATATIYQPGDFVVNEGAALGSGNGWSIIASEAMTRLALPLHNILAGWGGQPSSVFVPSSATLYGSTGQNYWATLMAMLDSVGGDCEAIFYNQGESGLTKADLTAIYEGMKAKTGRTSSTLKFYMTGTGAATGNSNSGETPSAVGAFGQTQVTQYEWCRDTPGATLVCTGIDVAHYDSLHYASDMTGYGELSLRVAAGYSRAEGYTTTDNRGPILTSAAIVGSTIELLFDLNGASAITCSAAIATNFDFATSAAMTSVLTPTAMAIVGNKVTYTFAAPPPAGSVVKQRLLTNPVVADFLKGTYGARSIMVWPVFEPVAAA